MVHAACWYAALVFAITHLSNIVVSVHSFFLFFFFNVVSVEQLAGMWHWCFPITQLSNIVVSVRSFFHFVFFNVVQVEQSMIPACPSLMCSFNRGGSEGDS